MATLSPGFARAMDSLGALLITRVAFAVPQALQSMVAISFGFPSGESLNRTPLEAATKCLRTSGPGCPRRLCYVMESPRRGL